jgi:acyl carrier protein
MKEENILKLNQIFIAVLELDDDLYLDGLDLENDERWDSLSQVLLIAAIESEFSISIDVLDYENFTSYAAVKKSLMDFGL